MSSISLLERGITLSIEQYKQEWFGNIRGDILSGLVVAS